jgi:hypothetical protein
MPRRADALDALRGFAILAMALQGMLFGLDLPAWMYHAQLPPPTHAFDAAQAGLTWVDLVFPFFLFSMGAALPLALARRLDRGAGRPALAAYALRRGLLLLAFAVYVEHIVPWKFAVDGQVSALRWIWSLAAFAALFPAFARLPRGWSTALTIGARIVGWSAMLTIVLTLRYSDDGAFDLRHGDVILAVLALNVTVAAWLWLASPNSLPARLGMLLVVLAIILGAQPEGRLHTAWNWQPAGTLFTPAYLKYLLIVLPGTIAGDRLRQQLSAPARTPSQDRAAHPLPLALLTCALCVAVCAGLQARWTLTTAAMVLPASLAGWRLLTPRTCAGELSVRPIFGWGVLWLAVGLLLEPYQGGIKKDPATLSYFFTTAGLACFALVLLECLSRMPRGRAWERLLIANGQNPMIAYVGIRNLLPPVLGLVAAEATVNTMLTRLGLASPWWGFGWACVKTLLLALAVALLTRLRVRWRT